MNHLVKAYLKFLFHSKSEHGIHSPFVFDLVTKCFYNNSNYPEYATLKNYRKTLLENKNTIEVTDFGAGSRVFKSNTRFISAIAKNAGISSKNAQLLFRIVQYFQPETILEIGTSLGLATSALALGAQSLDTPSKITSLEGCSNTLNIAKTQLENFNLDSVQLIPTEFSNYLNTQGKQQNWKLIYFDGNHSKTATLAYFETLLSTVTNDSVWIFDDIHWSKDMEEAWRIIQKHPKVTVTIDTFQWGMVFFRQEQLKEHFIINPKRSLSSYLFKKIKI
ncbi:class I SAM-dependent methyltransferase [Flavobacterium sp. TP390]|uniref:Class I SAM-dependent methyltransferase n=1 Tax=Flavobacterium profundi TaxID=1774945 RepID=A0A6I4IVF1_9FLAO|nr:class I SAM-dependent methyltransferase [Flavobacterium profundi]MVO10922.1 class I SAM-dependent methyltransferase [Flavobacterium profundi]